jgi:hypothetical protein
MALSVVAEDPARSEIVIAQQRALDRSADEQFPRSLDRERAGVAHLAG